MNKDEFLRSVPSYINHKSGYAVLEIAQNSRGRKGVCYRHLDHTASGGTYGANWFEVYEKLIKYLKEEGYMSIEY